MPESLSRLIVVNDHLINHPSTLACSSCISVSRKHGSRFGPFSTLAEFGEVIDIDFFARFCEGHEAW